VLNPRVLLFKMLPFIYDLNNSEINSSVDGTVSKNNKTLFFWGAVNYLWIFAFPTGSWSLTTSKSGGGGGDCSTKNEGVLSFVV
jgi:hypothetical protein